MSDQRWAIVPFVNSPELTEQATLDLLAQSLPTRVLLIGQGASEEVSSRLREFAERHHPKVLLWSYLPALPSLSAVWNRSLRYVWALGGTEALVVNNDTKCWPFTYEGLLQAQKKHKALFVSAVGVKEDQYQAFLADPLNDHLGLALPWDAKGGPDFSFFLITREGHERYPFDERFVPAFCVTPDTPVLTADLRWIPIGDIHAGDTLVGVDEHEQPRAKGEYHRRSYRLTKVTETRRRIASCLHLWLADGREVTCSTDHKWLTKYPSGSASYRWRMASELSIGYRIATPLDAWPSPSTYEEGWLAGIVDGEGTLRLSTGNRCEIAIAQKEGLVLDEIKRMLTVLGIPFTWRIRPENNVGTVEVGVRRHVLRLLGHMRPKRLLAKMEWKDLSVWSRSHDMGVPIIGIKPVGDQEVVTLETTAHTYLANGMIAHNCEDVDGHRRYMLGGDGARIFSVNIPYLHYASQTIKAYTLEERQRFNKGFAACKAYYAAKWGGGVNEERFYRPFEEPTPGVLGPVTTPDLQRYWQIARRPTDAPPALP